MATRKECLINKVNKLLVDKDTLFLLDKESHKIFIYNINGELIRTINKRGKGPEEYRVIKDFDIDKKNKHIWILDLYTVLKYKYDGTFVNAFRIKGNKNFHVANNLVLLNDSSIAIHSYGSKKARNMIYSLHKKQVTHYGNEFPNYIFECPFGCSIQVSLVERFL